MDTKKMLNYFATFSVILACTFIWADDFDRAIMFGIMALLLYRHVDITE